MRGRSALEAFYFGVARLYLVKAWRSIRREMPKHGLSSAYSLADELERPRQRVPQWFRSSAPDPRSWANLVVTMTYLRLRWSAIDSPQRNAAVFSGLHEALCHKRGRTCNPNAEALDSVLENMELMMQLANDNTFMTDRSRPSRCNVACAEAAARHQVPREVVERLHVDWLDALVEFQAEPKNCWMVAWLKSA